MLRKYWFLANPELITIGVAKIVIADNALQDELTPRKLMNERLFALCGKYDRVLKVALLSIKRRSNTLNVVIEPPKFLVAQEWRLQT